MKIIIDRSDLLKPLSHIQSVVERRNTIPILSNVVIKADEDYLFLSATDMDIDILEKFKCTVLKSGSITVTAHILYDIIRKLTEGSEILIEFIDTMHLFRTAISRTNHYWLCSKNTVATM